MTRTVALFVLVVAACDNRTSQAGSGAPNLTAGTSLVERRLPAATAHTEFTSPDSNLNRGGSASIDQYDDSLLAAAATGVPIVTDGGDTIFEFGGRMMDVTGPVEYGVTHYAKNGVHYIRIARVIGRTQTKALWSSGVRLRLPELPSTEDINWSGLCEVGGVRDPFIFAITAAVDDGVWVAARRAWRFDIKADAFHEISPAGVACVNPSGEV